MSNYYYLAAQLPYLSFASPLLLPVESFLEEAQKWLKEREFAALSRADINDFAQTQTDTYVLREYKRFDYRLREEISFMRKAITQGGSYNPLPAVKEVFAVSSPLEREKQLLYLRWKFIEETEQGHYFDLDFLTAYFLKMQILQKLFTFNKEKGLLVFDKVCEVRYG